MKKLWLVVLVISIWSAFLLLSCDSKASGKSNQIGMLITDMGEVVIIVRDEPRNTTCYLHGQSIFCMRDEGKKD